MKSKAPLALMEQLVMVLVFALAAAVCLQVFVLSDRISRTCEARDRAVLMAQSAAETIKGCGGDYAQAARTLGGGWDGQAWTIGYDEGWQETAEDAAYVLRVTPGESGQDGLGMANITVTGTEEIFSLCAAGQEVD